jgi:hypothetical protein
VTIGSVEPLKKLYQDWGDRVHFIDIVIRQAHPGPSVPHYRTLVEKIHDADRFKREEHIPWAVLVDDLPGTVHQVYGGMADPTYLIDADGRVAFYNMWTYAPVLHEAIDALVKQDGRGVVRDGIYRPPRFMPSFVDGWRGLRRGLPQSVIDLETSAPGMSLALWLGYQLRPILGRFALRSRPLPQSAWMAIWAGIGAIGVLLAAMLRRNDD